MINYLKPTQPEESKFESEGKIQDVIGFNKIFIIQKVQVIPSTNYNGDVARMEVLIDKKKHLVHTMSAGITRDCKQFVSDGMASVFDEVPNDNRAKCELVKYKTEMGTGFKLNFEV